MGICTNRDPNRGYEIPHFMLRISILSFLLMVAGLAYIKRKQTVSKM